MLHVLLMLCCKKLDQNSSMLQVLCLALVRGVGQGGAQGCGHGECPGVWSGEVARKVHTGLVRGAEQGV